MPDLSGACVVITRPLHQAQSLSDLIKSHGGQVILFPVIEIADPSDTESLYRLIDRLDEFDFAIFISANAVEKGLKFIFDRRSYPVKLKTAAVGASTAKALASHGINVDIVPKKDFNSETLLADENLQSIQGKKFAIFRGNGGRELLADTLRARGAVVEYAECYRRIKPESDAKEIFDQWKNREIDAIVATSNEGLRNLFDILTPKGDSYLRNSQFIVISERMVQFARELGINKDPVVTSSASDRAIFEAIQCVFSRKYRIKELHGRKQTNT